MSDLFRCCACRAYTLLPPLLVIRDRRVHQSCCVDCALNDDVSSIALAHHKPFVALGLLLSGRFVWSLPESFPQ